VKAALGPRTISTRPELADPGLRRGRWTSFGVTENASKLNYLVRIAVMQPMLDNIALTQGPLF